MRITRTGLAEHDITRSMASGPNEKINLVFVRTGYV